MAAATLLLKSPAAPAPPPDYQLPNYLITNNQLLPPPRDFPMTPYSHPHGHVFYRKMGHGRPKISHGQGIYLYDDSGQRYLDGSGGPLVVNVGHGRQEIVEAMSRQLAAAAYVHAIMFTNEPLEQYAAALAPLVPLPGPRFYFLSSGSEVVEGAIKLARQIQLARGEPGRRLVVGRHQSYHGMTLGALSVSGRPGLRAPYLDMMADMPHIQPPYPYRDPAGGEEAAARLEETILACGPDKVAAFIAEPISGASLGAVTPPNDYWPCIRRICDDYGVLLIADEVLTGFGRTGKWWGVDHWDVQPDIMVASKGIAGGYFPFGFIAARGDDVEQIRRSLGDFNHGGTFSHHAVGAAAALATLHILQEEKLVEHAARLGALLGARLQATLGDHPHVGDIRGRGLFWAIEWVKDRETKEPFPVKEGLAWKIWQRAFDLGLIVYYSQGCADGVNGDLTMIGPPLIITEEQVEELVSLLAMAVPPSLP
ncbi:MAG: aminotransferase class III-fold pyridoxal phosphate-dependent enzyme [Chloroflexi bacterium]|nr:aminotransferase class III-fold pyridoxal phosphate-dependent enzyme [Chloroflexota bacterium]MCI0729804.1 aminotransferase class III-fold pyridoxal phosphate-dependent enzyme [Chloroflexota bacterium]